ncbi:MAG: hypothetical protein ABS69_12180 [Nitrosomonadales bacterium SCN 54-20]|mgnify:CR=1 FL=1|nr:MAG: hypothetical protein ABS69_12180 [Nitrosomonadales bacterium SCN 54-20]
MLESLGAFAGGLAQGIRTGQDMKLRQQDANRLKKADEREAELQRARIDKADFNREKRERLRAANDEIAIPWQQDKQKPSTPGYPTPGLSTGLTETPAVVEADAGGLSTLSKPATQIPSDEMIAKRMLTGNLLEDANELTRMANIYKKYGLLEEMAPWMNKAYAAKKRGIPDALNSLLTGNARKAREILEKGGLALADDPQRLDEQQNVWKFRFMDGGETEIDLREFARRFFPSKIQK